MKTKDLFYPLPDSLIALEPQKPPRVLQVDKSAQEISWQKLLETFCAGDVLVINQTKVMPRRIFTGDLEILFLHPLEQNLSRWSVLFSASQYSIGDEIQLPQNIQAKLIAKGLPQTLQTSENLTEKYFEEFAQLPLPPYILKLRATRKNLPQDNKWYQTAWASDPGSLAAPTASLHFRNEDLEFLKSRGVIIKSLTLHVGLGTFLPIKTDNLLEHEMHFESVEIPADTWQTVSRATGKVYALGTTVCRALESVPREILQKNPDGSFSGLTNLFMKPGEKFSVVDCLLTNFHQPESTLLALVAAFAGLETTMAAYQFAVENKFRFLSYGDFSLWIRN